MARSTTATPSVQDGDLRARILDAAVALIDAEGLAGLSMREVARRAGVSHQAPYHHFASREDILAAIAQAGFVMLEERIAKARASAKDARQAFERAGRAYVQFALDHPAHFRLMFRPELVDMPRHPEAMDCGALAFAHVPAMVRALVDEGMSADPSEQAMVALSWSAVHGLACLLLDGPMRAMLPSFASSPEDGVRDAMRAMGNLLERSSSPRRKRTR
jgi:AcrR family transcriptional regulator